MSYHVISVRIEDQSKPFPGELDVPHHRVENIIEAIYDHLKGAECITVTGPDVKWLDDPEIYAELIHESKALRLRQRKLTASFGG